MNDTVHTPEDYDFRRYDRIWQRVSPAVEPYPDAPLAPRQEEALPGAEKNPCCLGSAAQESLGVLTGYIEAELEDRRRYLALVRCAPHWSRSALSALAAEEGRHAKLLMTVYYLITGSCYRPAIPCGHIRFAPWCETLRQRYHDEACGGMNYARSAEETTDPCLRRILSDLSHDEFRHAETVMHLLERSLSDRQEPCLP